MGRKNCQAGKMNKYAIFSFIMLLITEKTEKRILPKVEKLSDSDIVGRVLAGDKSAYAVLFERYRHLVYPSGPAPPG
jgi:hypothetical protein